MLLFWAGFDPAAWAGGPRFVAGVGWGVAAGTFVAWPVTTLTYFTDAGRLSPAVSKSQADAMVDAAAAVWSAPTSAISFARGGDLAEDVSTANTYFDGEQMVFPPDVQTSNENNVAVAIVYDPDGSLVDLLLGQGASDPEACRQDAVVGDIDDIHQDDATIRHATLILNGRCVGKVPEQLTQMQYQLARAFGRVLGLSWSQTNDNVFTAETTVTANQLAYWPLMHPIDVICGNYSYQCMSNPFTLRVDDLDALAVLYPIWQASVPQGKRGSSDDALFLWGILSFPSGQGMQWTNVTTHRQNNGVNEDWETTSGVTGNQFQQAIDTPVSSAAINAGGTGSGGEGYFLFRRVPLDGISDVFFTTEAINPLYMGDYAVGTYVRPPATPSGSPVAQGEYSAYSYGDNVINTFLNANDAANDCSSAQDGSEGAPAAVDSSGWQTGMLCSWGHNSWWTVQAAAGHSWTLEVTATDETGAASLDKAQPVMGVWNSSDTTGTLPTVASQVAPFNSLSLGMTRIQMDGSETDQSYRISVSDQFGAGRPDFSYVQRVLYAATVSPATVGAGGGQIVISGMGFRQGDQVLVNGAKAHVLRWSANSVVATAPSMQAAGAALDTPLEVAIQDPSTAGYANVPASLRYVAQPNVLQLVSAPAAMETGVPSSTPLAVRVLSSDGTSPVAGIQVTFSVVSGSAQLDPCGVAASCVATSDANGVASMKLTGGATGDVVLDATEPSGGALQVTLADHDPLRSVVLAIADQYVAAGVPESWTLPLRALQDDAPAQGVPVTWAADQGFVLQPQNAITGTDGVAKVVISTDAMAAGSVTTVTGCAWSTVCASWHLFSVDPLQWVIQVSASNPGGNLQSGAFSPVTLLVTDEAGHVLEGAPVKLYQRVLGWEGTCDEQTRCPAAPVLMTKQSTVTSSATGEVAVTPLMVAGVPQVVEIAATTGTYGFTTMTLVKAP